MHVVNIGVVNVNKGYLLGSFFFLLQPPYILFIGNNLKYLISKEIPSQNQQKKKTLRNFITV